VKTRRSRADTHQTLVRIGYLHGRGVSIPEISKDTGMSENALRSYFSKKLMPANKNKLRMINIRSGYSRAISQAAAARGVEVRLLLEKVVRILATDLSLLDNVLDDGVKS
jgi:hypothetical protein